jgi:hypothetical protein
MGLIWNGSSRTTGFNAASSQTRAIQPVLVIYDISPAGMHQRGTRKNAKCGRTAISPISGTATGSTGKVTDQPGLQSAQGQISSLTWKIIVLF